MSKKKAEVRKTKIVTTVFTIPVCSENFVEAIRLAQATATKNNFPYLIEGCITPEGELGVLFYFPKKDFEEDCEEDNNNTEERIHKFEVPILSENGVIILYPDEVEWSEEK